MLRARRVHWLVAQPASGSPGSRHGPHQASCKVGFTKIHVEELAPLRPFKHNEYDRFLVQAYPYCTGIFSTMGFVIFSVALLLYRPRLPAFEG